MWDLFASPFVCIDLSIVGASCAFSGLDIENIVLSVALDASFPIIEGKIYWTVGDIVILDAALIVLLDQVINGHVAEDPVWGIYVGLEDSWAEDHFLLAVGVESAFDSIQNDFLFGNVTINHRQFRAFRDSSSDILEFVELLTSGVDLI